MVPLPSAYVIAGMDTTINAIGDTALLFARHPQAYQEVRAEPALIGPALAVSEMSRIVVDFDRCEGHGLCEQTAPEVFRLDDEGELQLTHEEVAPVDERAVAAAVRVCPVAALKVRP
ncbi:ferredoxin [Streptomyces scabiei]|uniref:Ferredoxin n=1 Tax=Streptomyces scabiei TaxID=1930 RepID=A0A100JT99_STRSC|nr:ferredoxin fas2 [Streptomyces scabiei]